MKKLLQKLGSRKLAVTAVAAVATGAGAVEMTWPMALVAAAYLISQAYVDRGSSPA
jgi:hypothetical protein